MSQNTSTEEDLTLPDPVQVGIKLQSLDLWTERTKSDSGYTIWIHTTIDTASLNITPRTFTAKILNHTYKCLMTHSTIFRPGSLLNLQLEIIFHSNIFIFRPLSVLKQ